MKKASDAWFENHGKFHQGLIPLLKVKITYDEIVNIVLFIQFDFYVLQSI